MPSKYSYSSSTIYQIGNNTEKSAECTTPLIIYFNELQKNNCGALVITSLVLRKLFLTLFSDNSNFVADCSSISTRKVHSIS